MPGEGGKELLMDNLDFMLRFGYSIKQFSPFIDKFGTTSTETSMT